MYDCRIRFWIELANNLCVIAGGVAIPLRLLYFPQIHLAFKLSNQDTIFHCLKWYLLLISFVKRVLNFCYRLCEQRVHDILNDKKG
jgi:hypothetical protein